MTRGAPSSRSRARTVPGPTSCGGRRTGPRATSPTRTRPCRGRRSATRWPSCGSRCWRASSSGCRSPPRVAAVRVGLVQTWCSLARQRHQGRIWRSGRDLNPTGAGQDHQPSRASAVTTQACAASVSRFVPADPACFRLAWQRRGSRNRWVCVVGGARKRISNSFVGPCAVDSPLTYLNPALLKQLTAGDDHPRGFQGAACPP